ncbi:MAG: N-acyl homoserine lactonase family protein [Anaerolineae bacterium]
MVDYVDNQGYYIDNLSVYFVVEELMLTVTAIQTGITRVTPAFQRGNADRSLPAALFASLRDQPSIDLPIYAWLIEHDEGLIVVDTGDSPDTHRTPVAEMIIKPEESLAAQLEARGIRPRDIAALVLTHLHSDHLGGIGPFRGVETYVSDYDHAVLSNPFRRWVSAQANPIPAWLKTNPVNFTNGAFGAFAQSAKITRREDVIAVPTPGHTAGHQSVIVLDGDLQIFIAGDVTYSQESLLNRKLEGLSFAKPAHLPTLERVLRHVTQHPTVYLPSHDWESGARLAGRQIVGEGAMVTN